MPDPFDLARFVAAQEGVYATALAELRAGRKRTHWMWFIFPQVVGLGFSAMSHRYAITSRAEAQAYLDHPVLGPRLIACTDSVLAAKAKSIRDIFGAPDDLKFRSCMTLFDAVRPHAQFAQALTRFHDGQRDEKTLQLLA